MTSVGSETRAVVMSKKPWPLTAAMVIVLGTDARAGLLDATCIVCSWPTPSAELTTPCDPLVVDMGLTKKPVGAGPGVSVICHPFVTPPLDAVIVTTVVASTGLVWIEKPVPLTPAGIVTDDGTDANGEFVERLTANPPGPARPPPSRSIHADIVAPPVARTVGWRVSLFRVGGRSVNWVDAETPFNVAVSVIAVGVVTCPNLIGITSNAVPDIVSVVGTGASPGCELERATEAPDAGLSAVSCTATRLSAPLYSKPGVPWILTETGVAGAGLIVNRPVLDQAVTAAVVGEDMPCCDATRQNFGPDESDSISWDGLVYWL